MRVNTVRGHLISNLAIPPIFGVTGSIGERCIKRGGSVLNNRVKGIMLLEKHLILVVVLGRVRDRDIEYPCQVVKC